MMEAICGRCEKLKILRDEEYDCCDICQECHDEISYARENVMTRTVSAVGFLNGVGYKDDSVRLSAFLHIFHPELPISKRDELIRDAKARER